MRILKLKTTPQYQSDLRWFPGGLVTPPIHPTSDTLSHLCRADNMQMLRRVPDITFGFESYKL